jgi:hypothetical protein
MYCNYPKRLVGSYTNELRILLIGCAQDRSMLAKVRNVVHAVYIVHISSKDHTDARNSCHHKWSYLHSGLKGSGLPQVYAQK